MLSKVFELHEHSFQSTHPPMKNLIFNDTLTEINVVIRAMHHTINSVQLDKAKLQEHYAAHFIVF